MTRDVCASFMIRLQPVRWAASCVCQIDWIKIGGAIIFTEISRAFEILRIKGIAAGKIRSWLRRRFVRPDKAVQGPNRHEIPANRIERTTSREAPNGLEQHARA